MSTAGSEEVPPCMPQQAIEEFWDGHITKNPAKVTRIFPSSLYANLFPPLQPVGAATGKNAAESYKAAAAACTARVQRLIKECIQTNEKFTDPDFNITSPDDDDCLYGIRHWYDDEPEQGEHDTEESNKPDEPRSVHRINWIFKKPQFIIDGFSSSDLKQGALGDCWFLAAVSTICCNPKLMDKVCVARNEECGIYGFVFFRDGEWTWTVVDDNLYLNWADYNIECGDYYDPTNSKEAEWRESKQTGSKALYFASCDDENETWLPLLEKAYAKVHGDYAAIAGGFPGEGVEDLTGGVTTTILTDRILSKDRLWEELKRVGDEFLFSASSPGLGDDSETRKGLALSHAYSVLKAVDEQDEDGKKYRLVLIRNPWGSRSNAGAGEWTGPWSDGSAEWTPYWLQKLNHKFGDDGLFWMSYDDVLERFSCLSRTRLFNQEWTTVQRWTSVPVAWVTDYVNIKFSVEIKKAGPAVFVLCQLDDRYFKGIDTQYGFDLHFILKKKDAETGDYIVRDRAPWFGCRGVSAEVDLEPGVYEIVPKIKALKDDTEPDVVQIVEKVAVINPQKLRQIGLNYDIAHAKGIEEEEGEGKKKKGWERGKHVKSKASKKKAYKDKRPAKKHYAKTKDSKWETEPGEASEDDDTSQHTRNRINIANRNAPVSNQATDEDGDGEEYEDGDGEEQEDGDGEEQEDRDREEHKVGNGEEHKDVTGEEHEGGDEEEYDNEYDKLKPWNAVCVLGLRIYSLDSDISIQLIKPKNDEEADATM